MARETQANEDAKASARRGRLRRHWHTTKEVVADPRLAPSMMGAAMLKVWRSRGGGFYGLGYLVAFIVFEVQFFVTEAMASDGVAEFLSGQIVEYLLRFCVQSFVNTLLALLWPVYVLDALAEWGVMLLITGYFAFEKLLRPSLEAQFPELARPTKLE